MAAQKMHADEIDITIHLVQRLIDDQFPQWSNLPVTPVVSSGTDNALYRLGKEMVIRLPRIAYAAPHIDKEYEWLPQLASYLPIRIPISLGKGMPTDDFPWAWAIYRWLTGENATKAHISDFRQAATDIGNFVATLQKIDPHGAPSSSRDQPLATRDQEVRTALNSLHGIIDVHAATAVWEETLHAPEWNRPPVWNHGDLHPGNLLIEGGKLSAVIDFGIAGIGDPSCDMMVAWTFLSAETRDLFREIVQVDDATWARGRGWALAFGLIALPYYINTNPVLAGIARRTIDEVLNDHT